VHVKHVLWVLYLAILGAGSVIAQARGSATGILISAEPVVPLIEHRDGSKLLEFDFAVRNDRPDTLRLTEIELSIYDANGELATRKSVNSNGLRPGIEVVAPAILHPGEVMDVFNPFYAFAADVPLATLEFAFRYVVENSPEQANRNRHRLPMDFDVEQRVTVSPKDYKTKTDLILPLRGRVLVWDGHDFYSHHRRVPLDADNVRKLGIHGANANRYGSDLVVVNERGEMFHGDAYHKINYFSYGQPIYAPAAGRVCMSRDDIPDNEFEGKRIRGPKLTAGADEDLGNYVIIDHEDGEYSVFPHMKPGTVRVKRGERVRQGEILGQVGFSGDAIFPHVHYTLLSGPDIYRSEAVPAYFQHVKRMLGSSAVETEHTTLDSGDIVEGSALTQ
jgi:murein DD-endopeptidase MepM/ murein hydrolase activator NlpD